VLLGVTGGGEGPDPARGRLVRLELYAYTHSRCHFVNDPSWVVGRLDHSIATTLRDYLRGVRKDLGRRVESPHFAMCCAHADLRTLIAPEPSAADGAL